MKIFSFLLFFVFLSGITRVQAQPFDNTYFNDMKWRMIGPFRGGRTVGAVGVPSQPNVFYIGVNNGGVWKTTDFGRTWFPVFDEQPTGSIGDLAICPSNPEVIYAGSGEGLQRPDLSVGDGIYRSADAGKSWVNTGIKNGQQIGGLSIDPKNENRVFAAVLGHPYGPNEERGVFRTLNGGKSWEKVLYVDENTGAVQVVIDPNNPDIIFADLWAGRQGPWENGSFNGKGSGLYKSTDGGNTWKKLTKGLPTTDQGLGRIGFCIAQSDSRRLYATVDADKYSAVYRSDDAGESWYIINNDERYWGRGSDFAEVKVDPQNADIVYTADVVVWKSSDGGKTWNGFRGAPGGDDYHRIWINPVNPKIILIASDQGAIITVNGGETFSSWYNQPSAQLYHVSADNAFPYNVYSGQQESGSVGIASRGNDGEITFREWHPVAAEEYGYVVPDPLDPDIIYGGKISRYDKRNGQVQNIAPEATRNGKYRFVRTAPIIFSPIDKKTLYYAGNVLFKTTDRGMNWQVISPDLTRETWEIPASVGIYRTAEMKNMPRRGVIYTIAPSYVDNKTIWCGTDDGYVQLTRDGGNTWTNVTPPQLRSWDKVSLMDASHTDVHTAYAAVNNIRLDDMHPHIYRTKDDGKTWQEITNGLPDDPVNVVKEDPYKKGLLFAGTERALYVSFDDGDHWQSLRLNMPASSIRDLTIKDDDLIAATHGRGFWILDDITPLRQMKTPLPAEILYKPETAIRVRWDMNTDTPLPQEEPAGQNPPDGAIIDYYLDADARDVSLEILDEDNKLIRRYSNKDTLYSIPELNIPTYWIRPQQILSAKTGGHRFTWDLHYTPLDLPASFPIAAIYNNTAPNATSPWVLPGNYTVRLTIDGRSMTQPLTVKMDPRVHTSGKDLKIIRDQALDCYLGRKNCMSIASFSNALLASIRSAAVAAEPVNKAELDSLQLALNELLNGRKPGVPSISKLNGNFASLFNAINETDALPTSVTTREIETSRSDLILLMQQWKKIKDALQKLSAKWGNPAFKIPGG